MRAFYSLFILFLIPILANAWVSENRRIEQEIIKNYDRRHRPVRRESTVVRVQMFLTVNHIERVDEMEGTMLLHGILWASWYDEYLRWTPSEHNNTFVISMEAWKIWQPTFALYNSARSNSWFVFMNGVPATVSNDGRVFAAGTFSFQVTCQFDFSDYPYDVQECPIVLADWIYDLSKVNLSEAVSSRSGLNNLAKPAIRLSFDPLSENVKKHVAGWEVIDTWQRLCYWGPNGYCVDQNPIGPLDNYWSLIEFGVKIKRHAPYYGLTLVLPIMVTISLILLIFWIDNISLAIFLCVFNLILAAYSGLNLLQQLPPGDGVMPSIGVIHIWTVSLILLALILHCLFHFLLTILPPETKFLPEQMTTITSILRQYKFFQTQGISFDPQTIMGFEPLRNHIGGGYAELEDDELALTNQVPLVPDSLIIEMDSVESVADSSQVPSTSSQFQPIKLETVNEQQQSSEQSPTQGLIKNNSSGLFRNMFGLKEEKNKGPVISSPFTGGIFGGAENILKRGQNDGEEKGRGEEEEEDDTQLLIGPAGQRKGGEEEEEMGKKKMEEDGNGGAQSGPSAGKEDQVATKSPLENELMALRRLLFPFFLLASLILLAMLIF